MIKLIEGNLFDSNANIICHQCNCQGVMGSGVALEVKQRFPNVYKSYKKDYEDGKLKLGYVNFTTVKPYTKNFTVIANMCGQDKYGYDNGLYTHYEELQECLNEVLSFAYNEYDSKPTIAFPYLMSCHRGGGDWTIVYKMIEETFKDFRVEIWRM